mgnify:FL=1
MSINSSMFSSASGDWCTPIEIVSLVHSIDPIGLDPCSNEHSLVGAKTSWTIKDDGLTKRWAGNGLVYVNPPYGREIEKWVQKCCIEALTGVEIVALLPARVDTRWFQSFARNAEEVLFYRGRIRFLGAPNSAPFPSVFCYWGMRPAQFRKAFEGKGIVARWT